jgi:hypothetical protein
MAWCLERLFGSHRDPPTGPRPESRMTTGAATSSIYREHVGASSRGADEGGMPRPVTLWSRGCGTCPGQVTAHRLIGLDPTVRSPRPDQEAMGMSSTTGEPAVPDAQLVDAYIYILGRYLVIRQEHMDLAEDGVDYNVLKHSPPVVGGTEASVAPTFVNPNLDVVYSEAWLAVDSETPVILTVPEVPEGRYFTVQIVDEWAEILHNVNDRNFPDHPHGRFAICLAGSDPTVPDDCVRLDVPSSKAKLLARVAIGDSVDDAVRLQHGFDLAAAGSPVVAPAVPIEAFTNRDLPGAWMFEPDRLAAALAAPDSCPTAGDVRPAVQRIADLVARSEQDRAAIDDAIVGVAIPGFMRHLAQFSSPVNGWGSTGARATFGDDWRFRTIANWGGIWWNSALEVIYYLLTPDATGHWPSGEGTYTLRFAGDDLPEHHAHAFWSLTLYSHPDMRLAPNPLGRYSFGPGSDLATDDEGGFTIIFGPDAPASNWLPTPTTGEFTVVLRLYLPTDDIWDGTWSPPAMSR